MSKTFEITANGTLMGEYKGESINEAIDSYSQEAGYKSFADMCDQMEWQEQKAREELDVFELDIDDYHA